MHFQIIPKVGNSFSSCRVHLCGGLREVLPLDQLQGAIDLPGRIEGVWVAVTAVDGGFEVCGILVILKFLNVFIFRSMILLDLH